MLYWIVGSSFSIVQFLNVSKCVDCLLFLFFCTIANIYFLYTLLATSPGWNSVVVMPKEGYFLQAVPFEGEVSRILLVWFASSAPTHRGH